MRLSFGCTMLKIQIWATMIAQEDFRFGQKWMPRRSIITLTSPLSSYMSKLPAMVYLHCRGILFLKLSFIFSFCVNLLARKESVRQFFFFRTFREVSSLNLISGKLSLCNVIFDIDRCISFLYIRKTKNQGGFFSISTPTMYLVVS